MHVHVHVQVCRGDMHKHIDVDYFSSTTTCSDLLSQQTEYESLLREEDNALLRSTGAEEPCGPAALHPGFQSWRAPVACRRWVRRVRALPERVADTHPPYSGSQGKRRKRSPPHAHTCTQPYFLLAGVMQVFLQAPLGLAYLDHLNPKERRVCFVFENSVGCCECLRFADLGIFEDSAVQTLIKVGIYWLGSVIYSLGNWA